MSRGRRAVSGESFTTARTTTNSIAEIEEKTSIGSENGVQFIPCGIASMSSIVLSHSIRKKTRLNASQFVAKAIETPSAHVRDGKISTTATCGRILRPHASKTEYSV